MDRLENISIENASIIFRNFKGEGSDYNNPGNRNFAVLLDPEAAADLKNMGWNVKYLKPRDEEEEANPQAYLPVKVKYGKVSPQVYLVTNRKKTLLDEDSISQLDWAEFKNIDLIITPYIWERNGRSGVAAYLKTGYFVIVEDEFADKYSDIEDIPF